MGGIPARGFKWLSVLWAMLIGVGIIALAGAVLLPSTKRARVDWEQLHRERADQEAAAAAVVAPTTTTAPTDN